MKIQLVGDLNSAEMTKKLKCAEIVEEGDYLLYEKIERISVNDGFDNLFISIHDVLYIETVDGTQRIHTATNSYHSNQRLKSLESEHLFRISKSVLVNLKLIEDVKVKLNMRYSLKIGSSWLDVNRTYYNSFKERLGF